MDLPELRRLDEAPPLRQRIYEQLEGMITSGGFRPGVRLVESDLADTLGVSRGPIREALQLLWRDGFVDLKPRQGAFVHVPTRKEIDDFFDIRRALEAESARLATERITPDQVAQLRGAMDQALDLLSRGEDPSDIQQRVRWHEVLAEAADNPVLAQMLRALDKRSVWYHSPFEPGMRRRAWEDHATIVTAVISGDSAAAVAAMTAHIEAAREHLYETVGSAVD
jgi:DNA-binding GntR family transcriptional regulator